MPRREEEFWAGQRKGKGKPLCPICASEKLSYSKDVESWICEKGHRFITPSYGGGRSLEEMVDELKQRHLNEQLEARRKDFEEVTRLKREENETVALHTQTSREKKPPSPKRWDIEDNPKDNIGCGFIVLLVALIPLGISFGLLNGKDGFYWAFVPAMMLAFFGFMIIVANGFVFALGEKSATTIGKIVFGLLFLFLGIGTPLIWPGSFWVMVIPFIPLPYLGNVFLVLAGVGLLIWVLRE